MLASTPPMGFNTWNTFGKDINDNLVREIADAMVETGLKDAGYAYLVIDDCWSKRERDSVTGKIVPDLEKFPQGMKALSDYVHAKGLKFGMYSCAGVRTCADYPGSYDHEYLDAKTFAEYGCDFLKYDFCYKPSHAQGQQLYRRMGIALENCGREILFSACNWGCDDVHKWIRSVGAHMYRSTGDIFDNFESFRDIAQSQADLLGYSAPGCFDDMDMLTVGMYGKGNVGSKGCSDTDYRTQFSLWCLFACPLMLGCDVRKMNQATLDLVTNPRLLRINQDEQARPPYRFSTDSWKADAGRQAFFRHLSGQEYAIGAFNFADSASGVPLMFTEAGITNESGLAVELTDVFTGERIGVFREYYHPVVDGHGCALYLARLVKD